MKTKYSKLLTCIFLIMIMTTQTIIAQKFGPGWKSLHQYKVPEWFKNAKFGIFMHWGVMSVPANDGWYARQMYQQVGALRGDAYGYHLKHFGHPSKFGYKDLIPLWKAENWEPDSLVKFYKKIGAKYIVYVAVHHDNFDNYASTYQPWNSVNMGSRKDIVEGWKNAAEKYGLRFGVSSHSDRTWNWFITSHGSDVKGPLKGISYDGNLTAADGKGKWWDGYNPQDLYCIPHKLSDPPDSAYCVKWFNRTKELIDKYHPDLLYFDGPIPIQVVDANLSKKEKTYLESYGLRIAAHFYNENQKWHNGKLEAVLNLKDWPEESVPDHSAVVMDIEKGQSDSLKTNYWQTDTSLNGQWFYTPDSLELNDTVVVQNLCDIVSKNGNLLLNVSLKADGTLPQDQRRILLGVGNWLNLNGDAIYGTRPWNIFGEGPTQIKGGDFKENNKPFTSNDIRFTTKADTLFAVVFGWPKNGKVTIHTIMKNTKFWFGNINHVKMLGVKSLLKWNFSNDGLVIKMPVKKPFKYAYVLKIWD